MLRLNFLAFIAALAIASAAVAGTKLYSNGSWTLFSVTDFALNLRGKEVAFGKACVAETGGANGTLRIVVVLENYGIVQVVSPL